MKNGTSEGSIVSIPINVGFACVRRRVESSHWHGSGPRSVPAIYHRDYARWAMAKHHRDSCRRMPSRRASSPHPHNASLSRGHKRSQNGGHRTCSEGRRRGPRSDFWPRSPPGRTPRAVEDGFDRRRGEKNLRSAKGLSVRQSPLTHSGGQAVRPVLLRGWLLTKLITCQQFRRRLVRLTLISKSRIAQREGADADEEES
jgi:hypothetical protein